MYKNTNVLSTKLLTKEQEQELTTELIELRKNNTNNQRIKQIIDILVRSNQRLIFSIAKKYQNRGLELNDLIQEGNIGLMKAINKFNPELDYKFSTYAVYWIRHAITASIANQSRMIRIPVHRIEDINKMTRAIEFLIQELGRLPKTEEIAKIMNLKNEEVIKILDTIPCPISLETPMSEDSTMIDYVPSNFDIIKDYLSTKSLQNEIKRVLATLTPKEEKVIRMRFGIGENEFTLKEIADDFKVTAERIRQIECNALNKLRSEKRSKRIKDYI